MFDFGNARQNLRGENGSGALSRMFVRSGAAQQDLVHIFGGARFPLIQKMFSQRFALFFWWDLVEVGQNNFDANGVGKQRFFAAKVANHQGGIDAGELSNFAHGGAIKTRFGK